MVIQHNILAMNGNRMLGINTKKKDKAMEKLSSGYKINRAADDASGLQISEKMRKQIRGLTQASANAQDGISLIQTAEGAMGEISDIVNRMEEMAVHAANGTLAPSDREALDAEYSRLKTEIDRIKATTKFNDLYTLGGERQTWAGGTSRQPTHLESFNFFQNNYKGGLIGPNGGIDIGEGGTIQMDLNRRPNSGQYFPSFFFTFHSMGLENKVQNGDASDMEIGLLDRVNHTDIGYTGLAYTDANGDMTHIYIVDSIKGDPATPGIPPLSMDDLNYFDGIWLTSYLADGKGTAPTTPGDNRYYLVKNLDEMFDVINDLKLFPVDGDYIQSWSIDSIDENHARLNISSFEDPPDPFRVPIHVGADGNKTNQITVEVDSLDCRSLRLLDTDLKTAENALKTINRVDYANKRVSAARAKLGAEQNRLEHTIRNLDNVIENTQAAESIIRDTDMAREMVEYSKQQILEQAGQSVLAQAQQDGQGVLTLLG